MIDIVIVNWNSGRLLKNCVISIIKNCDNEVKNLIIIDNASHDQSMVGLPKSHKFLTITYQNKKNLGFAEACNQGASMGTSEYILFLNPDTELQEKSLKKPLKLFKDDEEQVIGVIGIQLVDGKSNIMRSCSRFPKPLSFLAIATGINKLPGLNNLGLSIQEWPHTTSKIVPQVIGAFFMTKRDIFNQLLGFDDNFFVYYEDLDFSLRLHNIGYRSYYTTEAQAFHAGGGTTSQVKAHRLFYSLQSRILYSFKHFTTFQAVIVFGVTIIIEPIARSVFSIIKLDMTELKNTAYGYFMLFTNMLGILKKLLKK